MLDYESLLRWSENQWEQSILPSLSEFISIEALSPGFEPKWEEKGELSATLDLFQNWADVQGIDGLESCLLYTSPSPRDVEESRMPSSA